MSYLCKVKFKTYIMKTISLVTFLLSSLLFTISPSQMFACVSVFGMVLSISIFIDSVVTEKKSKKTY
jgi:hypothetical protein